MKSILHKPGDFILCKCLDFKAESTDKVEPRNRVYAVVIKGRGELLEGFNHPMGKSLVTQLAIKVDRGLVNTEDLQTQLPIAPI